VSDIGQEDFRVEIEGGKYTAIRLVGGGTRWLRHGEHWEAANANWQYAKAINALIDELHEARTKKGDAPAIGQRAAHYGSGRQPIDDIKDAGWGPAFAASNVLKYIRRYMNKNGDDDIAKARWYWHDLHKMADHTEHGIAALAGIDALHRLRSLLERDEILLLEEQA